MPKHPTYSKNDRHISHCKRCGVKYPGRRLFCEECEPFAKRERLLKISAKKAPERKARKEKRIKEISTERTCPECGEVFVHFRNIYCSLSCSNSRKPSEESKMKASISSRDFHESPEGRAFRTKNSRNMTNIRFGIKEVDREDFIVDIPEIHFEDMWDIEFPGFEKASKW